MARVRWLKLHSEPTIVHRLYVDDACNVRDKQARNEHRTWIDLKVDGQALLAQTVQDLCKAGRARVGGIQAHATSVAQLNGQPALAAQQVGGWPIERRVEAHDCRDNGVR